MWLMVQFSITACCCLRPAYSICFPIHHNNCSLATGRCFALVMCFILRSPTQPVHYNSLQCSYNIAHPSHCTVCMDLLTQCFNHPMLNAQFDNTWPQNLCLIDSDSTQRWYIKDCPHILLALALSRFGLGDLVPKLRSSLKLLFFSPELLWCYHLKCFTQPHWWRVMY